MLVILLPEPVVKFGLKFSPNSGFSAHHNIARQLTMPLAPKHKVHDVLH